MLHQLRRKRELNQQRHGNGQATEKVYGAKRTKTQGAPPFSTPRYTSSAVSVIGDSDDDDSITSIAGRAGIPNPERMSSLHRRGGYRPGRLHHSDYRQTNPLRNGPPSPLSSELMNALFNPIHPMRGSDHKTPGQTAESPLAVSLQDIERRLDGMAALERRTTEVERGLRVAEATIFDLQTQLNDNKRHVNDAENQPGNAVPVLPRQEYQVPLSISPPPPTPRTPTPPPNPSSRTSTSSFTIREDTQPPQGPWDYPSRDPVTKANFVAFLKNIDFRTWGPQNLLEWPVEVPGYAICVNGERWAHYMNMSWLKSSDDTARRLMAQPLVLERRQCFPNYHSKSVDIDRSPLARFYRRANIIEVAYGKIEPFISHRLPRYVMPLGSMTIRTRETQDQPGYIHAVNDFWVFMDVTTPKKSPWILRCYERQGSGIPLRFHRVVAGVGCTAGPVFTPLFGWVDNFDVGCMAESLDDFAILAKENRAESGNFIFDTKYEENSQYPQLDHDNAYKTLNSTKAIAYPRFMDPIPGELSQAIQEGWAQKGDNLRDPLRECTLNSLIDTLERN
ncbi:hypothetical protein F5Y04DRAFT_259448 [Hypomontagnella monticulosa]|nr:hypothetical protein F5Y04DRAFT_259448 [Hypomontagnella monticulosa]